MLSIITIKQKSTDIDRARPTATARAHAGNKSPPAGNRPPWIGTRGTSESTRWWGWPRSSWSQSFLKQSFWFSTRRAATAGRCGGCTPGAAWMTAASRCARRAIEHLRCAPCHPAAAARARADAQAQALPSAGGPRILPAHVVGGVNLTLERPMRLLWLATLQRMACTRGRRRGPYEHGRRSTLSGCGSWASARCCSTASRRKVRRRVVPRPANHKAPWPWHGWMVSCQVPSRCQSRARTRRTHAGASGLPVVRSRQCEQHLWCARCVSYLFRKSATSKTKTTAPPRPRFGSGPRQFSSSVLGPASRFTRSRV